MGEDSAVGLMVDGDELAQITGVPLARLRQIAAEGYFAKAEGGNFKRAEALAGMFRYYRDLAQRLPVFDSIDACLGATGIPRAVIKTAKRCGCDAFKSNRVSLEKLLRWVFNPANEQGKGKLGAIDGFKAKKVEEESRLLEIKRAKAEGAVIALEDVERWTGEMVYAAKVELLAIPGKLAPQVMGISIAEAEIRIRKAIEESLMHLHREPWTEK